MSSIAFPRAILGCGTFGGIGSIADLVGRGLDSDAAFATLDEAAALGIDLFDTAAGYAAGESERVIGAWLAERPAAVTGRLRVATKVAPAEGEKFDRAYIEATLEQSLARLGLEQVPLYLAHVLDPATPIEATVEGFAAIVTSGRAAHIGCCNVNAAELTTALNAADRLGVPAFEWVQNLFNLLSPDADAGVRAVCRERGLGYTPFSPLGGGVLTGKYRRGEAFPEGSRLALRPEGFAEALSERAYDALDRLQAEAEVRGVSCAALAMAWVIGHPDCAAPVVGPSRSAPHLEHIKAALAIDLSVEDHARIAAWFE